MRAPMRVLLAVVLLSCGCVKRVQSSTLVPTTVQLLLLPNQPGSYEAALIPRKTGQHTLRVRIPGSASEEGVIETPFQVELPSVETSQVWLNEPLLKDLASSTGGQYFREEDLHKLPNTISAKTERVRSPLEVELWASPLYFLLMLGVVTAEWVLRKLSHLK